MNYCTQKKYQLKYALHRGSRAGKLYGGYQRMDVVVPSTESVDLKIDLFYYAIECTSILRLVQDTDFITNTLSKCYSMTTNAPNNSIQLIPNGVLYVRLREHDYQRFGWCGEKHEDFYIVRIDLCSAAYLKKQPYYHRAIACLSTLTTKGNLTMDIASWQKGCETIPFPTDVHYRRINIQPHRTYYSSPNLDDTVQDPNILQEYFGNMTMLENNTASTPSSNGQRFSFKGFISAHCIHHVLSNLKDTIVPKVNSSVAVIVWGYQHSILNSFVKANFTYRMIQGNNCSIFMLTTKQDCFSYNT